MLNGVPSSPRRSPSPQPHVVAYSGHGGHQAPPNLTGVGRQPLLAYLYPLLHQGTLQGPAVEGRFAHR